MQLYLVINCFHNTAQDRGEKHRNELPTVKEFRLPRRRLGEVGGVILARDMNTFLSNYIQLSLGADRNNSCIKTIISPRENCEGHNCHHALTTGSATPGHARRLQSKAERARTDAQPRRDLRHKPLHHIPAAATASLPTAPLAGGSTLLG